jgi:hypothetical protein
MQYMLRYIDKRKTTMRQAIHAVAMRCMPGHQGRSTRRAVGCHTKGIPKDHTLLGEPLQIGRWHRMPVRLYITPRVVRVQIDNIRFHQHVPLGFESERSVSIMGVLSHAYGKA